MQKYSGGNKKVKKIFRKSRRSIYQGALGVLKSCVCWEVNIGNSKSILIEYYSISVKYICIYIWDIVNQYSISTISHKVIRIRKYPGGLCRLKRCTWWGKECHITNISKIFIFG